MKKFLKAFMVYSYVTLLAYVTSENLLTVGKAIKNKGCSGLKDLKFESLWKTTFRRFKEYFEFMME